MGEPEKRPEDSDDLPKEEPKLDAILPDDLPPAAAELVGDIDSYQRRMEKEWETAKSSYEQKINRIMEEFVVANANVPPASPKEEEKEPPKKSRVEPAFEGPIPEQPRKKSGSEQERLKILMDQLQKELHRVERPARHVPFFSHSSHSRPSLSASSPEPLQLGWSKPTTRFSKNTILAALAGIVLVSAGAFYALSQRVQVTPIPYAHTLGPIVNKKGLFILDWFRRSIYLHENSSNLTIKSVESVINNMATGIAMSEKALWTIDALDRKILTHTLTVDHQITAGIPTPGSKPVGLYWDGLDLWSADASERALYRHRGTELEDIRDTFPLPEMGMTAFTFYKSRLWILDGKSRLIGAYRLQKPLLQLGMFDLDPFVKGATPTGFAFESGKILVVTENPALLIRIPISRLRQSKTDTL